MSRLAFLLLLVPSLCWSGAQVYEPLADSVRQRLSQIVAEDEADSEEEEDDELAALLADLGL